MTKAKCYPFEGKHLPIRELSEKIGISKSLLYSKINSTIKKNITINESLIDSFKPKPIVACLFEGRYLSIDDIAEKISIPITKLQSKIKESQKKGLKINESLIKSFPVFRITKSLLFPFKGENLTIPEISEKTGTKESILAERVKRARKRKEELSDELFLKKPKSIIKKRYPFRGKKLLLTEIARILKINISSLRSYVKKGIADGMVINEIWFESIKTVCFVKYPFKRRMRTVKEIARLLNLDYSYLLFKTKKAKGEGIIVNEAWFLLQKENKEKLELNLCKYPIDGETELTLSQVAEKYKISKSTLYKSFRKDRKKGVEVNKQRVIYNVILITKERFIYFYYNYRKSQENISYIEYLKQNKIIFNEKLFKEMLSSLNLELFKNPNLNIREFVKGLDIKL